MKEMSEKGTSGVTMIPNAPEDPSPDNDVYIYVCRNMPEEHQVRTTAHEGYGHAYFYELQQQGFDVYPFHKTQDRILYIILNVDKSIDFPLEEVKESYEANVKLLIQIRTVMKQAMQNYKNHTR